MTPAPTCPVCGKELEPDARPGRGSFPFCSPRCRLVDLYRWAEGKYAIVEPLEAPVSEPDVEDLLDGME